MAYWFFEMFYSSVPFKIWTNDVIEILRECRPHIGYLCYTSYFFYLTFQVRTQPDFIMDICPERSLPSLKYRCVECDGKLAPNDPEREPRLCDYTGLSFCPRCHRMALEPTPARIIHNWDFEPRPVSQVSIKKKKKRTVCIKLCF